MSAIVQQNPALMEVNPPLLPGVRGYHDLTEQVSAIVEGDVLKTPRMRTVTSGLWTSPTSCSSESRVPTPGKCVGASEIL